MKSKKSPPKKERKKKKTSHQELLEAGFVMFFHPIYGEIPLKRDQSFNKLKPKYFFYFDPSFKPKLPPGGLRGDLDKQDFCPGCHVPKYFYIDFNFECPECGEMFFMTAEEQKYWFEEYRVGFNSSEVRCPKCQKSKRKTNSLIKQFKIAEKNFFERPNDTDAMHAYAEMVVKYYQRFLRSSDPKEVQIALNRAKRACVKAHEVTQKNRRVIFQRAKKEVKTK